MMHHPHIRAILWMLLSAFGVAVMMTSVRYLSAHMPIAQIVLLRNVLALLLFLPWVMHQKKHAFETTRMRLYWVRAGVGMFAMYLWFYALKVIELPIAVSLSFTAPLLTAIIAMFVFGERYGLHRAGALLIGFIGTLVILQPGTDAFALVNLVAVAAAVCWAINGTVVKLITSTDSPSKIAFFMVLMMTPMTVPAGVLAWQPIDSGLWGWLIVLGISSNLFQVPLGRALQLAPFYVVLPVDFTRLIFASVFAWFFFAETITYTTLIGALLVMSGAVYTAYREAKHATRNHQ